DSTLEEVKDANEGLIIEMAIFSAQMLNVYIDGLMGNIAGASTLLGLAEAADLADTAYDYSGDTGALSDAIDAAQDVADDPNASQDDVDEADADLDDAAAGVCTALPGITGC
ncbi:hypothetical protein KAI87_15430, partial [Myxococcota bacterium]|nr:hypothetical protein [Myxococcota bacterium]